MTFLLWILDVRGRKVFIKICLQYPLSMDLIYKSLYAMSLNGKAG